MIQTAQQHAAGRAAAEVGPARLHWLPTLERCRLTVHWGRHEEKRHEEKERGDVAPDEDHREAGADAGVDQEVVDAPFDTEVERTNLDFVDEPKEAEAWPTQVPSSFDVRPAGAAAAGCRDSPRFASLYVGVPRAKRCRGDARPRLQLGWAAGVDPRLP